MGILKSQNNTMQAKNFSKRKKENTHKQVTTKQADLIISEFLFQCLCTKRFIIIPSKINLTVLKCSRIEIFTLIICRYLRKGIKICQ